MLATFRTIYDELITKRHHPAMHVLQLVTANYTPGGYKEHAEPASGGYKKNQKLFFVFGMY